MTPADPVASWLPVHHDMGLIGCLVAPVVNRCDLWLMRPEQFVRRPANYLRCLGEFGARLTAMPAFGLGYLLRRVPPHLLAGLDFSQVRAVIVGAERLDPAILDRFAALLAPYGLPPCALRPAYGLAESTLIVTGLPVSARWRRLTVDPVRLAQGHAVEIPAAAGGAELVGCGPPLGGARVSIHDAGTETTDGGAIPELPDGAVGEIVISGPSVAAGYADRSGSAARFRGSRLHSGDAGFLLDGQLYVLGRLGDAIKVRGRLLLAEDLEAALARAGLPARQLVVLLGDTGVGPTAVALVEQARPDWLTAATTLLRRHAEDARVVVLAVARGTILRTTSGKARRRVMWQRFLASSPPGAEDPSTVDPPRVAATAGPDGQHGGDS
jgi:acyl-CoA synthetase (AMP-forming)/AMP-acid ligase II